MCLFDDLCFDDSLTVNPQPLTLSEELFLTAAKITARKTQNDTFLFSIGYSVREHVYYSIWDYWPIVDYEMEWNDNKNKFRVHSLTKSERCVSLYFRCETDPNLRVIFRFFSDKTCRAFVYV